MTITHNIAIDFVHRETLCRIYAVQGDQLTRKAAITLTSANQPWPVPADAQVALRYSKPDGTGGRYDTLPDGSKCWEANENVLSVSLAPQMLTAAGCVNAQVEILQGAGVLATFTFQVMVEADPSAQVLDSEDYFNWVQWTQQQLDDLLEKAKEEGYFIGATPNLQIGTVSSLPAGSAATAAIRGTAEDPILDLGIPQGADPVVDATLTISAEAADAKVTGDRLAEKADLIHQGTYTGSINTVGDGALAINSVVWISADTADIPYSGSGICETWASGPALIIQRITFVNHAKCQRLYHNGAWTDWLWENPPMITGTEYLTTQRWNDRAVYAQTISCGTLVTGRKVVEVPSLTNCIPIDAKGYISQDNGNYTYIPSIYESTSETNTVVLLVNTTSITGYIQIFAGSGFSGKTAYVQVRYLKN